jgi:hypothetical protein
MFEAWVHEIARQRHQALLARADRDRLGRIVGDPNAQRRTASYCLKRLPGWAFGVLRLRAGVPTTCHDATASGLRRPITAGRRATPP